MALHLPSDLPRMQNDFIHIPPDQDVYISIKPNVLVTSKGLRRYSANERGCYFKSERKLAFFRSYSQKKCEMECLANFTKDYCECVHFAMPRKPIIFFPAISFLGFFQYIETLCTSLRRIDDKSMHNGRCVLLLRRRTSVR